MIFRTTILAAMLLCSGCIPTRWQDTPHLAGSVVDAATTQPIVGAKLQYAHFPQRKAFTGVDGRYDFPGVSHWGVVVIILPFDRFPPFSVLTVEAPGYISTNAAFCAIPNRTNVVFYLSHQ